MARLTQAELTDAIAAVCPIHGLRGDGTIDFAPEATAEHRQAALTVLASHTQVRRKPKTVQAIYNEIGNLPQADQNKIMRAVAAYVLSQAPKLARAVNVALDGDEEDGAEQAAKEKDKK